MREEPENMSLVDVVIVNWNAGEFLKQCLESISSHGGAKMASVVVVDNGSTDGSEKHAEAAKQVEILKAGENLGFGKACNVGARLGNAEFILFLNPDAQLLPHSIERCLGYMKSEEGKSVGICGAQLLNDDRQVARTCSRFPSPGNQTAKALGLDRLSPRSGPRMVEWDHSQSRRVDQVMGAFFFMRRSVFEKLNGFDERFFVYYEEVDLSRRALDMGWTSQFLAEAQAIHHGGGSSNQIKARRMFYSNRCKIQYAKKHFGPFGFAAVSVVTLFIEPLTRIALSLARFRLRDAIEVFSANRLLYGWALRSRRLSL